MNLLDKLVSAIDPIRAAKRQRARMAISATESWVGASSSKRTLRNFIPSLKPSNEENEGFGGGLASPRTKILARTRQLTRSNPIAGGALKTMVTNVIGKGLSLQMRVDYERLGWTEDRALKWQADVEARFEAWATSKNCDLRRTQTFYGMQRTFARHFLRDGEGFFMLPFVKVGSVSQLALQLVDPIRVSNPNLSGNKYSGEGAIVAGIKLDTFGAPISYSISRKVDNNREVWDERPAFDKKGGRQVFHVYDPEYCDESRGMSMFAPVVDQFNMIDKYTDAELTAAVVSSYFTVFVQSKSGAQLPTLDFEADDSPTDEDEIKLGPGAVVEMDGDTTITSANPGRPNDKFDPFVEAILRQIGVSLGLPFEMLIKHFRSSYSAARAALLDGWKYLSTLREFIGGEFCQQVFERWLDYEVATGRIKATGYFEDPLKRFAYLRTAWIGDSPGSLDPVKEATAREIDLRTGVLDLDEACMSATGSSYMEKHSRQVKIAQLRRDAGLSVPGGAPIVASAAEDKSDPKKDKPDPEDDSTGTQQED
jgi:lambda family phage portal protein